MENFVFNNTTKIIFGKGVENQVGSELKGYKFINIMDDSGLENLKKVKLSYQPLKLIPAYIAKRKNEAYR